MSIRKRKAREIIISSESDQFENYEEDEIMEPLEIKASSCRKNESSLWVDKYRPRTINDLAIHKSKIAQVQEWFKAAVHSNSQKILVLKGPAGAGKTALIRTVASELNYDIKEFSNSPDSNAFKSSYALNEIQEYSNTSEKITGFIQSCIRSNSLQFSGSTSLRYIAVIEDIPNISHWKTKEAVHECLKNYARSTSKCIPLVFILSNKSVTDVSWKEDVSLRSLIPPDIVKNDCIVISLNPIAKTFLKKALLKINDLESLKKSNHEIEQLATNAQGDIRSAIYSLQFLKDCKRENQMSIFHGLGKILYNKREDFMEEAEQKLIKELNHMKRLKIAFDLQVILINEGFLENVDVDKQLFCIFLQENFLNHCIATEEFQGTDYFSESDLFYQNWDERDSLIEYGTSTAIRGAMIAWDSRVKKRGSGFKPLVKSQLLQNNAKSKENFENWRGFVEENQSAVENNQDSFYLSHFHRCNTFFYEVLPFVALLSRAGSSKSAVSNLPDTQKKFISSMCDYGKNIPISNFVLDEDPLSDLDNESYRYQKKIDPLSDSIKFLNELKKSAEFDVFLEDDIEEII